MIADLEPMSCLFKVLRLQELNVYKVILLTEHARDLLKTLNHDLDELFSSEVIQVLCLTKIIEETMNILHSKML